MHESIAHIRVYHGNINEMSQLPVRFLGRLTYNFSNASLSCINILTRETIYLNFRKLFGLFAYSEKDTRFLFDAFQCCANNLATKTSKDMKKL